MKSVHYVTLEDTAPNDRFSTWIQLVDATQLSNKIIVVAHHLPSANYIAPKYTENLMSASWKQKFYSKPAKLAQAAK